MIAIVDYKMGNLGSIRNMLKKIGARAAIASDIELMRAVTSEVTIPVIACGGAGKVEDFGLAVKQGGASAVAAGGMVVYQGDHRAVLVSFPTKQELRKVLD